MRVHNQTGSTLTKRDREHTLKNLVQSLRQANMAVRIENINSKHIERYISMKQEAGVSLRTLQNQMAHIRTELRAMGRDKLADSDRLSCSALGISGASRNGTHQALSQSQYTEVLGQAQALHPGFAAALQLQRELGLRMRETIQSVDSLKSWERALQRGHRVHILHGTKGGRARDTMANDPQKALQAVQAAIGAVKANGGRSSLQSPSQALRGPMGGFARRSA